MSKSEEKRIAIQQGQNVVAFRECNRCKEPLRIVQQWGKQWAVERASGERHVCWSLPEDANLLVLDD